jgi:exodeoxyribonuclease III
MALSIVSYNVNGIRSALSKGWADWVRTHGFDIVCVQETKAQPEQVDLAEMADLGYHAHWHSAQKKGYSGVATFSKRQPDQVVIGCGIEKYDNEGRIIRTDFGDLSLLNCYFPSGTTGDERQGFKMEFLDDFFAWAHELKQERPNLIIVGDYNIAHTERDIHDPKGNKNSSGFLPEEREWLSKWFNSGFVDAFRHLNPDKVEYSWWSFRAGTRKNNKGWRIDYQSVSEPLAGKLIAARQMNEAEHSDHCPVLVEITA